MATTEELYPGAKTMIAGINYNSSGQALNPDGTVKTGGGSLSDAESASGIGGVQNDTSGVTFQGSAQDYVNANPGSYLDADGSIVVGGGTSGSSGGATQPARTKWGSSPSTGAENTPVGIGPEQPPLPGADPLTPTYPAPDGTTSGQQQSGMISGVNQTPQALSPVPAYTNEHGWGAANVTGNSFVWVDPATGQGNTFATVKNADGTVTFNRSDGATATLTREQALQWFPPSLMDVYYGNAQPLTNAQPGTVSGNSTVGTSDWSVQPGHSLTLPDGGTLSVTSVNPDGTITWRRSDGSTFANVSRDVFESLLGKEAADQWYGKMSPGSIGGVARVEGMRDAMPEGNALPDRFQPAQMQPYTREIDRPLETVQGQLQGMLASGSPLLQRAEAGAAAAANARGLINSTMAVQAGRAAIYDVALKIAEMDANIYNAKSRDNMQALNAADAANVSAANQFIGAQLAAELQITQTNAQLQADIAKINAEGAIRLDIANAESTAKIEQILIDANARKVMQANATAGTLLQNTIASINTIMLNKDGFDANAKDAMIGRQITMFKTGIALIEEMGGDVNLSGYLDQLNMALGIAPERAPPADTTSPGGEGTSTNLNNGYTPSIYQDPRTNGSMSDA